MRYIPPAQLFGDAFTPPFDKKAIQRERKKLLAELELSGKEGLELNGYRLSRNEIIDYFDELQLDVIGGYHAAIAEDETLLGFLRDGRLDEGTSFGDAAIYDDPGFLTWLSPYFYTAFTEMVTNCLGWMDEVTMKTLVGNRLLMTDEDRERAWLFIAGILNRNIALLDAYHGKGGQFTPLPMPFDRITDFVAHGYIRVIEQLPDSRFGQIKDAYAFSIQHPAIAAFNRNGTYRGASINWIEDAKYLAVSRDVKARIGEKLEELESLQKRTKKGRPWGVVWLIVIGIRLITMMMNSSSSSDKTFTPGVVTVPLDSSTRALLMRQQGHPDSLRYDSILTSLHKKVNP